MIIDAHCHLVPSQHGIEITRKRMAEAGVGHTLLVPGGMIPALGLADFLRGRKPLEEKEPCNDFIINLVRQNPENFSAMYHFNPNYDDIEDAEAAIAAGFVGFKLNPIVDRVSYEDPLTEHLFAFAAERNLPLYTHIVLTGGASLDALEKLMSRHPKLVLILGHMGFASSDGEAIALAHHFENMLLETSVGAFHAINEAYRRLGARKLVFGSEGPAHHPAVERRKIELLNAPQSDFDLICGGNIKPFLSLNGGRHHGV